ncbi:PREDICTED: proline-rich protein PRCC isoform X2 [Papilio polytes]|uniref:proline-rich protein PRCC isoform X2 n=1 Tax=Papilio polytes TaxID=76194 RepID=UPI000676175B|nr:PREDICTED: proline-rich protein PRCC isoform X2 [Papilio polytes]
MSLVAYDNSDSSDYEDDQESSSIVVTKSIEDPVTKPSTSQSISEKELENESDSSLFIALPQPTKKVPSVIEEEDEFLHKKETTNNTVKPKSKITVPSLSDFKDVTNTVPIAKPRAVNGKKSGLLSILPQPKNGISIKSTKSLIPNVLRQNTGSSSKKKPLPTVKKAKSETNTIKDSDESDNEDVSNDFFSINKPIHLEDVPIDNEEIEISKEKVTKEPRSIESYFKKDVENPDNIEPESAYIQMETESVASLDATSTQSDMVLDEEAILKLVGARGKRKREEIQIVDVNQQEVLAEARQLLLKGLMEDTSKRVSASKKKGNEPTNMQKRKHQITYLAHQAKANEVELQNKWANNRMSKRQTQSKYGF